MPIEISQWKRQIGIFSSRSPFSNTAISIYFSIRGLLKFYLIFTWHIIFFIIIALYLLVCGILNLTSLTTSFICIYKFHILYWFLLTKYLFHLWICELQVILSGDVELNLGPKPNSGQNFSICHWNLNSIPAHNFSKISLLSAYNFLHKFDIICFSETYLDSSILSQDTNLEMTRYTLTLIRADHPSNVKRGEVFVYYKNHLPLKLLNINYLPECITSELSVKNKFCIIAALYRSTSQSQSEFTNFTTSLELPLHAIASKKSFLEPSFRWF